VPLGLHALGRGLRCCARYSMELVYPLHCAACGCPIDARWLCAACAQAIQPMPADHCRSCGALLAVRGIGFCSACRQDEWLQGGACGGLYEEGTPLAAVIGNLKYRGDRALVRFLGPRLVQASTALPKPEAVTFVPMTRRRQRHRGFNQAQLLARFAAQTLELPLASLLRKRHDTAPQAELPRAQRLTNVSQSFSAVPTTFKRVWLVDDVRTTGATLRACAQALHRQGVAQVQALVLAVAAPQAKEGSCR